MFCNYYIFIQRTFYLNAVIEHELSLSLPGNWKKKFEENFRIQYLYMDIYVYMTHCWFYLTVNTIKMTFFCLLEQLQPYCHNKWCPAHHTKWNLHDFSFSGIREKIPCLSKNIFYSGVDEWLTYDNNVEKLTALYLIPEKSQVNYFNCSDVNMRHVWQRFEHVGGEFGPMVLIKILFSRKIKEKLKNKHWKCLYICSIS